MPYKIYNLDELGYKFYREDTKRGKNCPKDCVERKLTALMLCASEVNDNGCGCKIYKFGTFNIGVRENSDDIGMVYWTQKSTYVSPEQSEKLHKCYELLGLAEDGQSIVGPIREKELEEYCVDNNLSNTREFRPGFLDFSHVLDKETE